METANLNENELEVLRILWERGEPLKPADIQSRFGWRIENATLRSVLVKLVRMKHITRGLQGKAFFYAASVPKTTLLQSAIKALARVFAGGSASGLVVQLVETGDIKPDDLRQIREAAAQAPKNAKRKQS